MFPIKIVCLCGSNSQLTMLLLSSSSVISRESRCLLNLQPAPSSAEPSHCFRWDTCRLWEEERHSSVSDMAFCRSEGRSLERAVRLPGSCVWHRAPEVSGPRWSWWGRRPRTASLLCRGRCWGGWEDVDTLLIRLRLTASTCCCCSQLSASSLVHTRAHTNGGQNQETSSGSGMGSFTHGPRGHVIGCVGKRPAESGGVRTDWRVRPTSELSACGWF